MRVRVRARVTRPARLGRRGRRAPTDEELEDRGGEVRRAVAAAELLLRLG